MKILHVINALSTGGAERLVADLAPLQRERGHEVAVLLFQGGKTPFRKILDDAGIRVFDFGKDNSVYSPLNIFRIIPYLKNYDLVHVHLFPAQYWVAFAKLLSFSKVRLVTTEHSTHNRRRDIRLFRGWDRLIYRQYARIAGISPEVSLALKNYLGAYVSVETICNGVNLEAFAEDESAQGDEFSVAGCDTLLVQVAGFREAKDQDTVIRALTKLPEDIHVAFVGDGVRRSVCEKLADDLGVRSRVRFLGIRADVSNVLKVADIVVMSSHWEGFGLAAVEGMAAGKPVVASDVPGLAEVVGGAGVLFPKGDEKALAQEILRLVEDKAHYAKTAEACSRRAEDFDIRKMCEAYLKIYGE